MESPNHNYNQFQVFRYQLNKLQTYKSSFQAWKCVSFGYALLASVLLFSKWHEVSTDLQLLNGIDQLLNNSSSSSRLALPFAEHQLFSSLANSTGASDNSGNSSAVAQAGELLDDPGGNATFAIGSGTQAADDDAQQRRANASQALVSHMQISLSREANGNQLLKQEIETFLGEFKSAKSTLGLSSLLVFVYIISWILMTLAVNDTRISNDVSLRNILLLSVFGAIDMAASIGFVMVRLIMFNARSGSIAPAYAVLGNSSRGQLDDAPSGLSSDQLTAFTALRLISMRSCSAYIDIYVSVVVALLTILRLYAIVRAIAYYRFLRRFNDLNRNYHHQQQLAALMTGGSGGGGGDGGVCVGGQHQTSEKQAINSFSLSPNGVTPYRHDSYLQQNGWHAASGGGGGGGGGGGYLLSGGHPGVTNHHLVASPRHNSMSALDQLHVQQQQQHQQQQQQQHVQSSARATPIQDFQFVPSLQPVGAANFVSSQAAGGGTSLLDQQQQQQALNDMLKSGSLRAATTNGQQVVLSPVPTQNQRHNSSKQPLLLAVRTDDQQQQQQQHQESLRTPARVEGPSQQHVTLKPQHSTNSRPSLLILTTTTTTTNNNNNNDNNDNLENPNQQQHQLDTNIWTSTTALGVNNNDESNVQQLQPQPTKTPRQYHRQKHHNQKSSAPNLLLLNGRAHKLVGGYDSSTGAAGFESEPAPAKRHRALAARDDPHLPSQKSNTSTSRANLLELSNEINNTSKPNSFTLLSASQLDRLSRKLLANATGSLINASSGRPGRRHQAAAAAVAVAPEVAPSPRGDKYKLIGRYRPIKGQTGRGEPGNSGVHEDSEAGEEMAGDLLLRTPGRQTTTTMTTNKRALEQLALSSGTSSSGLATDSDDLRSSSPSDARLRAQQQQLVSMGVASRRHGGNRHLQQAEQVSVQHRNSRAGGRSSKPAFGGGGDGKNHQALKMRASLASLRQTEEFNVRQPYLAAAYACGGGLLSPGAAAHSSSIEAAQQKRDLLLKKYYYT